MLSRAVRPATSSLKSVGHSQTLVRCTGTTSSSQQQIKGPFALAPERDFVNFPRPTQLTCPPARFGFISDNLFKFFYPKTGYTGGYCFGVGVLTYVLSKEIWVLEHEFWNGIGVFGIIYAGVKKFGKPVREYIAAEIEKDKEEMYAGKNAAIKAAEEGIAAEKRAQYEAEGMNVLFEAKKENVALQLEANYRERLMEAYSEVKKRLDYQVEKQNVERNLQQKHMVSWIVSRVTKAITPESEQENVKKCIADLKALAARA